MDVAGGPSASRVGPRTPPVAPYLLPAGPVQTAPGSRQPFGGLGGAKTPASCAVSPSSNPAQSSGVCQSGGPRIPRLKTGAFLTLFSNGLSPPVKPPSHF